jgi:hypothetical protein
VQFGIYGTPWGIPAKVIDFVLPGSVALVIWQWGRLGWQARGLILAAYGVFILGSFLPPALRSRERQKRGAQAQGSVVGVVQETNDEGDRFYHPGCASSRRTVGRWNSRPPSATASSPKSAPRCRFATSRRSPAGRRGQRRHLATARSTWLIVRAGAAGGRGRRVLAGIGGGNGRYTGGCRILGTGSRPGGWTPRISPITSVPLTRGGLYASIHTHNLPCLISHSPQPLTSLSLSPSRRPEMARGSPL